MPISPLSGDAGQRSVRILKGGHRLPICDQLKLLVYLLPFRVTSIYLWTGNDVMPISPLGGVVGKRSVCILKGGPRLPICD